MRKQILVAALLLTSLSAFSQDWSADTLITDFPDEYLDTVQLRVSDVVNDVSTIGINFGGTFTGMNFNPSGI